MTLLAQVRRALAVVAHPDDESFGLGAVLGYLVHNGAEVSVLCFTRGEASTSDVRQLRSTKCWSSTVTASGRRSPRTRASPATIRSCGNGCGCWETRST